MEMQAPGKAESIKQKDYTLGWSKSKTLSPKLIRAKQTGDVDQLVEYLLFKP
jgi:hypothetical protein